MTATTAVHPMRIGLVHEITNIDLAARQGTCSVEPYLALTTQTHRLIAYAGGVRAFLPMPTDTRQAMLEVLFLARRGDVERYGGDVRFAPLRLLIRERKFRAPDLLLVQDANDPRRQNDYRRGADLATAIVSPDAPARDRADRPRDRAAVGIPEYLDHQPARRYEDRDANPGRGHTQCMASSVAACGAFAPARQLCRVCR